MDFLKVITIILFILLTIFTIKIHPDMHQPIIIEDEHFQLTRISDTITTKNIPTEKTTQPESKSQVQQSVKTVEINDQPIQTTDKYIQPEPQRIKRTETKVVHKNTPETTSQLEILQQIIKETEQEEPVELQKPVKPEIHQPEPKTTNDNPYMTEQEEIIAWNRWRSNLQNQIMRDSRIDYAPLGTLFTFTFVVDKFGNISNIKIMCSNPNYMDIARSRVKPAIANLQRKPILKFPKGSRRTSTIFIGGFTIRTHEIYASPENYSDYERITY